MTEDSKFVDYYETLEISPNANSGTIERMFRYLAQRYHPDNKDTGSRDSFDALMEAGTPFGIKPFGIRAMDSLRLEKSYKLVGRELSIEYAAL